MFQISNKTLVKTCNVGDYSIKIGINRKIASDGIKLFPDYWDKTNRLQELTNSDDENNERLYEMLDLSSEIEELNIKIIANILPDMLEIADNEKRDKKYYENLSEEFLKYCEDMNVLFSYYDDDKETTINGIGTKLMEFVMSGFSIGGERNKPKATITLN